MSSKRHVLFLVTDGADYLFDSHYHTQTLMVPGIIAMGVAATRMHRSLANFGSHPNKYVLLSFDLASS